MPSIDLRQGDCLDVLRELADASIDACVCDPPYGLSDHPDAAEVLRAWLEDDHFDHAGKGFMGRSWDSFVPGPRVWREVYRVLKPGGHLLAFAGTRSQDFMGMSIRLAGFEIRDVILNWVYSEGFPKGIDVSKAIDNLAGATREVVGVSSTWVGPSMGKGNRIGHVNKDATWQTANLVTAPATDEARKWSGWNTTLKASQEPVLVARKPIEGTVVQNVLRHGTGALNIGGCRVQTMPRATGSKSLTTVSGRHGIYGESHRLDRGMRYDANLPSGRWPTNLTLTHHPACIRVGERRVPTGQAVNANRSGDRESRVFGRMTPVKTKQPEGYGGEDEMEAVELWACVPGCVVRALDDQVGPTRSGSMRAGQPRTRAKGGVLEGMDGAPNPADIASNTGAASRFYPNFHYWPKVTGPERDIGLEGGANRHVSVKPIAMLRWLVRLVLPPGGRLVDPYMGSGSMGCATVLEGGDYLGIELDPDNEGWVEIARRRIQWCQDHPGAFDPEKRTGAPKREDDDQIPLL